MGTNKGKAADEVPLLAKCTSLLDVVSALLFMSAAARSFFNEVEDHAPTLAWLLDFAASTIFTDEIQEALAENALKEELLSHYLLRKLQEFHFHLHPSQEKEKPKPSTANARDTKNRFNLMDAQRSASKDAGLILKICLMNGHSALCADCSPQGVLLASMESAENSATAAEAPTCHGRTCQLMTRPRHGLG